MSLCLSRSGCSALKSSVLFLARNSFLLFEVPVMGFCLGSGLFVLFLWEEAGVASGVCRELGGSLFVVLCLWAVLCLMFLGVGVLGG